MGCPYSGHIAADARGFVIFFWDPLEPHPHDVDVKAADFLLSSPLMHSPYERLVTESERRTDADAQVPPGAQQMFAGLYACCRHRATAARASRGVSITTATRPR
jgi:hypothetical protein